MNVDSHTKVVENHAEYQYMRPGENRCLKQRFNFRFLTPTLIWNMHENDHKLLRCGPPCRSENS